MNKLEISNKELIDFVSLEEASQNLNMAYSTLVKWLNKHKEIREKYCFKAKYQGRIRTLIYVEAFLVILNVKDTGRNIPNGKKALNAQIPKIKEQIAEKVIQQVKISKDLEELYSGLMNMKSLLDNQIKTFESIHRIDVKVDNHEERILTLEGDTENLPMTQGQRERLNERLRFFCANTKIQHSLVWRDLHDITGRRTLNDYVFADYKVALGRLRSNYKLKNLKW